MLIMLGQKMPTHNSKAQKDSSWIWPLSVMGLPFRPTAKRGGDGVGPGNRYAAQCQLNSTEEQQLDLTHSKKAQHDSW
jgi:hypothetical protein